ncbi:centrosomal protein of 85 kDa-like isoform X1 [Acipenser ruthenus]|uniref:centrosomal protein of 85 kDa-like isoform X1 n=1 Tax=Acipenser ruthenus TaxID=7906 RepID=UPI0027411A88|nr:centrosomal protein of 85 kDa-like isoform X1 [Acipenser ruthenus]
MWGRLVSDYGDGINNNNYKIDADVPAPGWLPGAESTWQAASSSSCSSNRGRRLSTASDSGDTGIGMSCSDSIEDHSSSSTSFFKPIKTQVAIPTAHVMPSTSRFKSSGLLAGSDWCSCLTPPARDRTLLPPDTLLDMKDPRPMRRCSSLTKLNRPENGIPGGEPYLKGESQNYKEGLLGDSAKLYSYKLTGVDHLQHRMQHVKMEDRQLDQSRSPGSKPRYKYEMCSKGDVNTAAAPSFKPNALDMTFSALPESKPVKTRHEAYGQRYLPLGHQAVGDSLIQPAVRTEIWLSEQMHANPVDYSRPSDGLCGLTAWQHQQQQLENIRQEAELMQIRGGSPYQVNTLMKIKEDELRQKELVIDRQKQQIAQLHQRMAENELQVEQVIRRPHGNYEDPYVLKESQYDKSPLQAQLSGRSKAVHYENGELAHKLAAAELQVLHLHDFLKQNTHKYTEEIKKLEEKMTAREKYISSVKKKYQKESEQNQERQQRIETLEKYLADLPSLDDIQTQAQQLEVLQETSHKLQETVHDLEERLAEHRALVKEKEDFIERQKIKEKELIDAVQSLQQKVEQCLEDGARLPMLNMKQLECENDRLQQYNKRNNQILDNQKRQIGKLTAKLQTAEQKLAQEESISQELRKQAVEKEQDLQWLAKTLQENQRLLEENCRLKEQLQLFNEEKRQSCIEKPLVEQLLKEMSQCLLDLKALCSILTQRAQGKEPNLALLLGIKSMTCSSEETENINSEDSLVTKLSVVCQLRKDVDELRTVVSDRYAQDMGDNCITQ